MLLSATEAIYSGDLPVKKIFTDKKLTYKPKEFVFSNIQNKPIVIALSNSNTEGINGVCALQANTTTYKSESAFIIQNLSISGWEITGLTFGFDPFDPFGDTIPIPGTVYYQASGLNPIPDIPPLTGWKSTNPTYNPVPTLTYNSPSSAVKVALLNSLNTIPFIPVSGFYISNSSVIAIASATNFDDIQDVNLTNSFITNFDNDFFPNIVNYSSTLSSEGSIIFNNHNKIQTIVIAGTPNTIQIHNNPNLKSITYSSSNNLGLSSITNNPVLTSFSVGTGPNLTDLNLKFNQLRSFSTSNTPKLSNIDVLSSYPNFQNLNIGLNNLLGYQVLDIFLSGMSDKSAPTYTYNNTTGLFGRSNLSNESWLNIYKKNGSINLDIDPLYPIQTAFPGYLSASFNEITVNSPVSTNNTNFVQHRTLSGIYTKIPDLMYNNRDVYRNINDFYILYNNSSNIWTIVGPTSSSNTVWLSSFAGVGDDGNIPSIGWSGSAYRARLTSNPSAGNSGWYRDTSVFSTQMYLFSSFFYSGGTNNRVGVRPLSGFNSNFYWSDYNFSGIGYQNVSDPTWNGRWTLISPVHYINAIHFPNSLSIGSKINFIHKDGTISTRTVLSARNLTSDIRIGIFDAPLSAAAYPIGSFRNFITGMSTAEDFKNFLYGPVGSGRVGIGLPNNRDTCSYNVNPSNYTKIFSIPKSLWFTETAVVGDSSSQFWYADPTTKQLTILGLTKFAGPAGETTLDRIYSSLYSSATALCNQFYENPLMYQLTAYNF